MCDLISVLLIIPVIVVGWAGAALIVFSFWKITHTQILKIRGACAVPLGANGVPFYYTS